MAKPVSDEKARQLARIEDLEGGGADAATLERAWREAKDFQLNLRGRLRRAVASSASLPPRIARDVMLKAPAAFFANPALPLILMELPDLLLQAPKAFWDAAFASEALSPALMPSLVAAVPFRRIPDLARRPEFEAADAPVLLRRMLATLGYFEGAALPLGDDDALAVCIQWTRPMLDLPPSTVAALRALRHDERAKVILARCAQVPLAEALAFRRPGMSGSTYDAGYALERSLAARTDMAPADLADMVERMHGPVREVIAANPSAPPATLAKLAKNSYASVCGPALLNPSLPRSVYEPFLAKGTTQRRTFLAARPDLTPEDYARLAAAGESDVRLAVAQNPHAPPEVLARLGDDLIEEVREEARRNPQYPPDAVAPQADLIAVEPAKKTRKQKATLLERARPLLLGDMSAAARWEQVLAWVERGGERPKRATMSPADRKKLLRAGLKILGEDPAAWDAQHGRLFVGMIDGLGCLPELNGPKHRAARGRTPAQAALAEAWMARLVEEGFTEAESLALLLDLRLASHLGSDRGMCQRVLGALALQARLPRVTALAASLAGAKAVSRFVDDVARALPDLMLPPATSLPLMVALLTDPATGPHVDARVRGSFVRAGGSALLDSLPPDDADALLRGLDARYAWQYPQDVVARMKRLGEG